MKQKSYRIVCLCISLVLLLSGCSTGSLFAKEIELTEEQENRIDRFVAVRDKWETYKDIVNTYYINRVYVSEDEEGNVVFSVAYEQETNFGYSVFVEFGYRVTVDKIMRTDADNNCLGSGTTVDMETISDDELREVLRQSYKKYLSKQ